MKDFREIKFVTWFKNKLMQDAWNTSAMVNDDFTFEVAKETEKAIQLKVINTNKLANSWTIWCPKSAIENIDYILEEVKEEALEKAKKEESGVERMDYKRFKKHFSDCQTIPCSFNKNTKTIDVIIPKGRMKPSGVRGEHFSGYEFEFTNSKGIFKTTYRAVCKENAIKRLIKDFKPSSYKLIHIY